MVPAVFAPNSLPQSGNAGAGCIHLSRQHGTIYGDRLFPSVLLPLSSPFLALPLPHLQPPHPFYPSLPFLSLSTAQLNSYRA